MRVIGTAGHVDHGKSTLIAALTGTHPDRLKEEQEREMTIDLGFGWMELPGVGEVGIVDVPGHRDFVENMLAGIGGIDAALLVVAADEGVMPQTREHLAILDLLKIPAGVIVLTKIDLAPEPAWLDLVEADVRALIAGTQLHDAVCVRVSARTQAGLDELREALQRVLAAQPERPDLGRPRLPIDRVFTMAGFGTVVTGTLTDGRLGVGDEMELLPSGRRGRIRGLQTHRRAESEAVPGSRTAVNIGGLEKGDVARGEVVVHPGQYRASRRLDMEVSLLRDISRPLGHGNEVKCFLGTSETLATVRVLGLDALPPGGSGYVQLELRSPVVAVRGDRCILRRPSPGETLGGGRILDPEPQGRHRRFSEKVLGSLAALAAGSPAELLMEAALASPATMIRDIVKRSGLSDELASAAISELKETGRLLQLEAGDLSPRGDQIVIAAASWSAVADRARSLLDAYHRQFPLRKGVPREEFRSRLKLPSRVFGAVIARLASEGVLVESDSSVSSPNHTVTFNQDQERLVQRLLQKFAANPYAPPSRKECEEELGDELLSALIDSGRIVPVSAEVLFRREDYEGMVAKIRAAMTAKPTITLAEVRDLFDTSRKYIQALLEHLDAIGVTLREGDARRLRH